MIIIEINFRFLLCICNKLYVMGWSIVSAPVLKFISGLASLGIELYIYCYGFNHIEIAVILKIFFFFRFSHKSFNVLSTKYY